jgi:hypothetical protein
MDTFFAEPLIRFGTSGTLIFAYGMADGWARRAGSHRPARLPGAAWIRAILFFSITAFYLLIGPMGGALAGGWGNAAGILGVLVAAALRIGLRHGHPRIRYPEVATRVLFYAALPLAVGVPLGWLALTLPATATSALTSIRADRLAHETAAAGRTGSPAPRSFRWVPGIW